jgi:hypothetical protein
MDSAFTPLDVDRIVRKVPVHHSVVVQMEVQPPLTDRSCCEHRYSEQPLAKVIAALKGG